VSTPTFCEEGLRLGQLQGNAFSIVLREARVMEAAGEQGGEQGGTCMFYCLTFFCLARILFFDNDSVFDNDSFFQQKEEKEEKGETRRCGGWWPRR